jgi:hypothetical protein
MKIAPSSFVNNREIREEAKDAFDRGDELILEVGGPHDEKAISDYLSLPDSQKDIVLGATVGGAVGVAVGAVVDHITQAHPVAGGFAKFFLGVVGMLVGGGMAANEAPAAARQTPTEQASTGCKVLDQSPAVDVTFDPQTGHWTARRIQQSTT